MTIEIFHPRSREEWLARRMDSIGASEISALFGAHDWTTAYELYAVKSGLYAKTFAEAEIETDAIHIPPTERGNLFEDDAFELLARLRPDWGIEPNQIPGGAVYIDTDARLSSTPDAFLTDPSRPGSRAALQVKTMNDRVFKEKWQRDGSIEPPLGTAVQAIADATLSGCDVAYAGAMVVGFKTSLYLIEIPLHDRLMAKARELSKEFWRRVAEKDPFPPDYNRDAGLIARMVDPDDDVEVDLAGDNEIGELLEKRAAHSLAEREGRAASDLRKEIDARLMVKLGNAARGRTADGRVIEIKVVKRRAYEIKATQYPQLKIKGEAA